MLFTAWLVLGVVLLLGYSTLMLVWWYAWKTLQKPKDGRTAYPPLPQFSVIVPARNEANHIAACLASLMAQEYPKEQLEILVIDDDSEDETGSIVADWAVRYPQIRLLRNQGVGKKAAIQTGIEAATAEWVACTDADCRHSPHWLRCLAIENFKGQRFIAGPVLLKTAPGMLAAFQQIDFMMMQGITAAAVSKGWMSMCNGANIAYRRDDFFAVNGFEGIDGVPTGDDMLLMHKITQLHLGKATWLLEKGAIVTTPSCSTWSSFLQQRIRWGSKATIFTDKRIFWVLLLVYCINTWLVASIAALWWVPQLAIFTLFVFILKIAAEFPLVYASAGFFGLRGRLGWFVILQPLHALYIVVAGWLGKFGSYQWKGRRVSTQATSIKQ